MFSPRQINSMIALFTGLGLVLAVKAGANLLEASLDWGNRETPRPMSDIADDPSLRSRIAAVENSVLELDKEEGIDSEVTSEGAVIKLEETLLFQSGKADIQSHGLGLMKRIIETVSQAPGKIRVEGHTDNEPITHATEFESNYELSMVRALNVATCLAERGGIDFERISVIGYGALCPRFPNDRPDHRAKNRRVEIVLEMNGAPS